MGTGPGGMGWQADDKREPYDRELGKITDHDRQSAIDLLDNIYDAQMDERLELVAQWIRKCRYEAVIADRKNRSQ